MSVDNDIRKINKNLGLILAEFQNIPERKRMIKRAAKPMINEIRSQAPMSAEPHARYEKQPKLIASIRTPKGMGKILEIIEPGRLKKSIGFLPLRKTSDVFIGPRGMRKKTGAPYYAAWQEFGTVNDAANPFMRPGYDMTKGIVINKIRKEYEKKVSEFGKTHSV